MSNPEITTEGLLDDLHEQTRRESRQRISELISRTVLRELVEVQDE